MCKFKLFYIYIYIYNLIFAIREVNNNKIIKGIAYMWTMRILILTFVNYCESSSLCISLLYYVWSWSIISHDIKTLSESVINICCCCRSWRACLLFKIILGMSVTYLLLKNQDIRGQCFGLIWWKSIYFYYVYNTNLSFLSYYWCILFLITFHPH